MNQVERDELIALQSPLFPLIVAGDLSCQANRTLLNQGSLTVDRHVYLFNGTIYVADILSDTAYRSLAKSIPITFTIAIVGCVLSLRITNFAVY